MNSISNSNHDNAAIGGFNNGYLDNNSQNGATNDSTLTLCSTGFGGTTCESCTHKSLNLRLLHAFTIEDTSLLDIIYDEALVPSFTQVSFGENSQDNVEMSAQPPYYHDRRRPTYYSEQLIFIGPEFHVLEEWQWKPENLQITGEKLRNAAQQSTKEIQNIYPWLYDKQDGLLAPILGVLGACALCDSDPPEQLQTEFLRAQFLWEAHCWIRLTCRLLAVFCKLFPKALTYPKVIDLLEAKGRIWFSCLLFHQMELYLDPEAKISNVELHEDISYRDFQACVDKFERLQSYEVDYTMETDDLFYDGSDGDDSEDLSSEFGDNDDSGDTTIDDGPSQAKIEKNMIDLVWISTVCPELGYFPPNPYEMLMYPNRIRNEIDKKIHERLEKSSKIEWS